MLSLEHFHRLKDRELNTSRCDIPDICAFEDELVKGVNISSQSIQASAILALRSKVELCEFLSDGEDILELLIL